MNEAETRAELIDPKLRDAGWGVVPETRVLREYNITAGRIQSGGRRGLPTIADYVLVYKGRKLAVIEAKKASLAVGEGVAQAKEYAQKLCLEFTYATNGTEIYEIRMERGIEGIVYRFPTPDELWDMCFPVQNNWKDRFAEIAFDGTKIPRFYQEIAINRVLDGIAEGRQRMLLTLATGTGKTTIAFQIAWKLFQTRWNLMRDGSRRPRILFLADRNILANQAYNEFTGFNEDAKVRIKPSEISKKGRVPMNGSIFFTIFQTFMSGANETPHFGQYPPDFFDLIIIDECHRGGANDESNWRSILDYFAPAVQLGLTATPKRTENTDTYRYFGDPVYIYSLKEGINDGFLTPFKVKRIQTTLDTYTFTPDDILIEGEIEHGRVYVESDFNRIIEIREREKNRVEILMGMINQNEKTLVFCATQEHAAAIRDLINQGARNANPHYCVRVTANDGLLGESYLSTFQDNEMTIPTILTTSQKLSTGVDARNVRNIVLLRPVNNMIEFKQIIGRGTRLFDGKDFFTIYDFVNASERFSDPDWDGEPLEPEAPAAPSPEIPPSVVNEPPPGEDGEEGSSRRQKVKIKLRDGKEREIQHMVSTSFWSADGRPVSAEEFMNQLFGAMPEFAESEEELRNIWGNPTTRKALLTRLEIAGFGADELHTLQRIIDAENSDLFDVLEFVAYAHAPITRESRVANAQAQIFAELDNAQRDFLEFVLHKYIESGVEELDQEKLPQLLELKYQSISEAMQRFGGTEQLRNLFVGFQRHLYAGRVA